MNKKGKVMTVVCLCQVAKESEPFSMALFLLLHKFISKLTKNDKVQNYLSTYTLTRSSFLLVVDRCFLWEGCKKGEWGMEKLGIIERL